MAAILWLVAGILLAAVEVATGDFFLLMLAGGALSAAGVSVFLGEAYVLQAVVFALVSVGLVAGARPALLRKVRSGELVATGSDALVGQEATVVAEVADHTGQVKLAGEVWSARAYDPTQTLEVGRTVQVMEIDGATAVVWDHP